MPETSSSEIVEPKAKKAITMDMVEAQFYVPQKLGELIGIVQGLSEKVDSGFKRNDEAQSKTNDHLKELNGKVAKHEMRLNDQDSFRESVTGEAKEKAESAAAIKAQRTSAIYSIIVSVITVVVIAIVAYYVFRLFNFNLFNPINP